MKHETKNILAACLHVLSLSAYFAPVIKGELLYNNLAVIFLLLSQEWYDSDGLYDRNCPFLKKIEEIKLKACNSETQIQRMTLAGFFYKRILSTFLLYFHEEPGCFMVK